MTGIRVVFDGYWLVDGPPSGRNVIESTIVTWKQTHPEDELVVAVPTPDETALPLVDALPAARRHVPVGRVKNHQVWVRTRLGTATRDADLVVSQHFTPSTRGRTKTTAFVYDVMFREHPEWFTFAERVYLRAGFARTMRRADAILTECVSERDRIARQYPFVADRIVVTGLGVPVGLERAEATPVAFVGQQPFILSVGRLNVRKNLDRLIEAYRSSEALSEGFELLVVGQTNGRTGDFTASATGSGSVRFLGGIGDGQLKWLYQHAALFVFPSLDEGFGLPLLEARALGARSAASDTPVFRELGLANGYFDPTRVESIRSTLEGLQTDTEAEDVLNGDPTRYNWGNVVERIREQLMPAAAGVPS